MEPSSRIADGTLALRVDLRLQVAFKLHVPLARLSRALPALLAVLLLGAAGARTRAVLLLGAVARFVVLRRIKGGIDGRYH